MSENLELILANFDIDLSHIEKNGNINHKFIAVNEENKVLFYAALASKHYEVASRFKIAKPPVGSGSFYIEENKLVINNPSIIYGSVSREAAEKLAFIILNKLKESGINVKDVEIETLGMNCYWNNKTFLNTSFS